MYFKNKNTGVTWHITDEAHQKRLQVDRGYFVVSDIKSRETTQTTNRESVIESIGEKVDYKKLEWQELRNFAIEKGINVHGKKREQIEKELAEIGDINVTE